MIRIEPKIIFFVSMILIIIFISIILHYSYKKIKTELYEDVPIVSFPFKNLFDENQKPLNIILISAPFRETKHEELYQEYKDKGLSFCGISSYLNFPGPIDNPFEDHFHVERKHDYIQMATSWLHCFREDKIPTNLKQSNLPMILMTEADLKNSENIPFKTDDNKLEKKYDFMYCCLDDNDKCDPGWQSYNRNWELAKKCLEVMCSQFNLKGILVGRQNCEFTNKCNSLVKVVPFLAYSEFQEEMQKCKFLFVPNISDASPRVMTEAMCYNMPVLVNYNIIGGWHNVIPSITGEFFTNENDIIPSLSKIVNNYNSYQPRGWFQSHRGVKNSGKVLAEFLKESYPNLKKDFQYATITI
jgi:hypothetical protein